MGKKKERIRELEAAIASRDEFIEAQNHLLEEREGDLIAKNAKIQELYSQLSDKHKEVTDLEDRAVSLEVQLVVKDKTIRDMDLLLAKNEKALGQVNAGADDQGEDGVMILDTVAADE